jgi:hypothetical protein
MNQADLDQIDFSRRHALRMKPPKAPTGFYKVEGLMEPALRPLAASWTVSM